MTRVLVLDASVVVDLLAQFQADSIADIVLSDNAGLAAPELLDIEVLHTFRRLDADGKISARRKSTLLRDLQSLPIRRYRHDFLRDEIWRLRKNFTAYDAAYVSLARYLNAELVTRDRRIARAPRLGVSVVVP